LATFKPSPDSRPARQQALQSLAYLKRAATRLEEVIGATEADVPSWVESRITQAAGALGMAVSYFASQQRARAKKPAKPTPRKRRR